MNAEVALGREHFAQATDLLIEAFLDNSAHVYIAPDTATREGKLRWLFSRNLLIQSSAGRGFGLVQPGTRATEERLVAMGFWRAPGAPEVGLATLVRHGLALAPFRLGFGSTRRMLETSASVEAQRHAAQKVQGADEAWYLHNMVVARDQRGSGVGSTLLGDQLRSRVDPSGAPAVLATQRPENVVFYERLGFECVSEARIGTGEHRFTNWILIRPACSATT